MNKYRKALHKINNLLTSIASFVSWHDWEQIQILEELVDKETPKKRIFVEGTPAISAHYICPVCKIKVSPIRCYCDGCGQRLE